MVRQDPESNLRQAPFRAIGSDDQIAAIGHDAADADGIAVDRGDDGLGELAQHLTGRAVPLRQALDEFHHRGLGMGTRVLEIGAGRECAARLVAGQHGESDFGIGLHRVAMSGYFLVEILAPGVARLGPAQGEPTDVAAFFIEDRHRKLL